MMHSLSGRLSSVVNVSLAKVLQNRKNIFISLAGIAGVALMATGYTWYRHSTQEAAQKAFFEALRFYNGAVTKRPKALISPEAIEFTSEEEKWARVVQHYEQAYQRHKGAGIGPMFKVYQADALINLGQHDEAIKALEDVVNNVASVELREFLQLKLALMKIDSTKPTLQADGLKVLTTIASDTASYCHESGLYYLGYYYFAKGDTAQAKNYWQQLMVKYGMKDDTHQSGLAEQVRGKLKMISADW